MDAKIVFLIFGAIAALILIFKGVLFPSGTKTPPGRSAGPGGRQKNVPQDIDEEMEEIKYKLALDTFIGLDPLFELYARQRREMLLNRHLLINNGGTPSSDDNHALLINKNVTSVINLLRIITNTRQGRKLLFDITGGYMKCEPVEGYAESNNRKQTHKRDNGKVIRKR